jgi:TolB-like protein
MRPVYEPGETAPDAAAVREALARIGASDALRTSPQLVAFLTFVVEAVLSGRADRIKAYAIGVEALGRGTGFDPQVDPIVRVEATRLRRAIERYYAKSGAADPVLIDLPRGTYVPSLRYRAATPAVAPSTGGRRSLVPAFARSRWILGVVAATAVVVALVGVLVPQLRTKWTSNPAATSAMREGDAPTAALPPGNGMPSLAVLPFAAAGAPPSDDGFDGELRDGLRDAFARFDGINVVSPPLEQGGPGVRANPGHVMADYRLDGSIEYLGDAIASVQFRLTDNREDKLVWTQAFDRVAIGHDRHAPAETVIARTAAVLLPPFGIIQSLERAKGPSAGFADPRYRCLLAAVDSFRAYALADQGSVRRCLERMTILDPSFASGFALLALVYNREFLYGQGTAAEGAAALDLALRAARHAVELDPASARAYQILGLVLFYRKASPEWQAAGEKALLLNKFDPTISSLYGGQLVAAGDIDRGMALLQKWDDLIVVRPAWEHFYLFLGHYMRGNIVEATHHAEQIIADAFPGGLAARAALAGHNGDHAQARRLLNKLFELQPSWRDAPIDELKKFIPAPLVAHRLARDLDLEEAR